MENKTNINVIGSELSDRYLRALIEYKDIARITLSRVNEQFFDTQYKQNIFRSIKIFYRNFSTDNKPPDKDTIKLILEELIPDNLVTSHMRYLDRVFSLPAPNYKWILKHIDEHIQKVKLVNVIDEVSQVFNDDIKQAKDKLTEYVRTPGIGHAEDHNILDMNKDDVESLLTRKQRELCCPTGISALDKKIGGLYKQEITVIMGISNVGKSWSAIHLAANALIHSKFVLFIAVEMRREDIITRLLQNISATTKPTNDNNFERELEVWDDVYTYKTKEPRKTFADIKYVMHHFNEFKNLGGILSIPEFSLTEHPSFSVIAHKIILSEVQWGKEPDLIIIDGLTDMEHTGFNDPKAKRIGLTNLVTDLRTLAHKYNLSMVITHQANRSGIKAKHLTMEHVGESYGIMQVVENAIALEQTPEEYDNSVLRIKVLKARHGYKNAHIKCYQHIPTGQFHLHSEEIGY